MRAFDPLLGSLALGLALFASACLIGLDLPDDFDGRPCDAHDACLPGYECADGTCVESEVGMPCDPAADDCQRGFCWFGADTYDFCTITCSASRDCPGGFRCSDQDADAGGAWVCLPEELISSEIGLAGQGDACALPSDCQSGRCEAGLCIDTCQAQRDCHAGDGLSCQYTELGGTSAALCLPSGEGGAAQGEACSESADCALGTCYDDGFDGVCSDPCCSAADCPVGFACWVVSDSAWVPGDPLVRTCIDYDAASGAAFGSPCLGDLDCASALCLTDPNTGILACTDTCCGDEDCPVGYRCEPLLYDVDGVDGPDSYLPFCVTRP